MYAYMKQLVVDGGGKFSVCKLQAETEEALNVKRDVYLADDWQDATEAEYHQQFAGRTAPVESAEDKALGEAPKAEEPKEEAAAPVETSPDAQG
jgi:hypothetical protein